MDSNSQSLEQLRSEIDRIDDSIHDLLMERASLVGGIAGAKGQGNLPLRPGREAQVLRRLMARHTGDLPRLALLRIWREIMGALSCLQGGFSVAAYQPERGAGFLELSRNNFGVVVPIASYLTAGSVVRAVADGQASVGVVPIPEIDPWWAAMASQAENTPRIIARLPFLPTEGENLEAFVIGCRNHENTGADRSLLVFETEPVISRDRLRSVVVEAGFGPTPLNAVHRSESHWLHLFEVEGYVASDDPRLAQIARDPIHQVSVIGGYPVQLSL